MSTVTARKGSAARGAAQASAASVSRVQAKLSLGKSGDSYEQEADRTADRVVAAGTTGVVTPSMSAATPGVAPGISRLMARKPEARLCVQREAEKAAHPQASLQRQAEEEEEEAQARLQRQEEEEPQAKLQRQPEEEEEEAQARLQRQEEEEPQAKLQRQPEEEEGEARPRLQRKEEEDAQPKLRRQAEEEEEAQARLQRSAAREEEKEKPVQSKAELRANVRDKRQYPVLNQVEDKLFANKGRGEKLDDEIRRQMEVGFGADFSRVRIHTGADAVGMSRDLKAQAFTHGRDVFFNSGKYEPNSLRGRTLLAHELTHVVQQGAAQQKLAADKVEQNNARINQAPPEPADKDAREAEQASAQRGEGGPAMGPAAPGGEGALSPPLMLEASAMEKADEPGEGAGSKEKPKKGRAGKRAKGRGEARPGKAKAEGKAKGGVGAFLRKLTDKVFKSKQSKIGELARNERKKEPADGKLKQAESSVVPPEAESRSRSNAAQVATVERAEAPQPDEKRTRQAFDEALDNAVPSTLEEVDRFKEEGKGRVVGEAVKGVVSADTDQVRATYQEVDNPPEPAPPESQPEVLPEIESAPETATIDAGDGVVGEVQSEHTDFSEFETESDDLLKKEGIEEEHLAMVDEGDLAEAGKERNQLKTQVKEGPATVKAEEAKQQQQVDQALKKEELEGRQKMREQRQTALQGARGDQQKTKSKLELQRQQVTDHINSIYTQANDTVKQRLEELEKQSLKAFDDGQAAATRDFENNVKRRIDAFKRRRYDRFGGSLLWAKDKLFGMDELPEVSAIFESEKGRFVSAIDGLVQTITAENKRVVQACREIVADARKQIQAYVDGLGPQLRRTGADALKEMKGKLDALDKQINDREQELQAKLAERREAAIKAIEEKIEKMKEAMSGLLSKLGNLLLEAMLKFFKWALKKAGYSPDQLMAVIDKGKSVIKKIVGDPIGFIKNIVTAVKTGIGQFQKNIKKHLVGGMISWLTGAMADVPITLPAKWDLKGILHLVLQILGLTWDRIRTKLVKRIGEPVVRIAETSVDIVKRLVTEGPIALWEMIKAKAVEIKQKVMDGIRNWAIVQLVKQGIIKLVSFLNPAGAIVQAVLAIYNTIMFFVENWQRIVQFVKSVFHSIADIAMGRLSKAAQLVEKAMAMTIPIILGFLARLIGISGIGKAVSKVITKIRKPIDRVVNKVIDKVAGLAKRLMRKGKAGVKAARAAANRILGFVFPKQRFKAGGESHQVYFKGKLPNASLMVASKPKTLTKLLNELADQPENASRKATVQNAGAKLSQLDKLQEELANNRKKQKTATPAQLKTLQAQEKSKKGEIKGKISEIAFLLAKLMQSQDIATKDKPLSMDWPKPASKDYPTLWFGPKSDNVIPQALLRNRSINQIEAKISDADELKKWRAADRPIERYDPENPAKLPSLGPKIGVTPPYTIFSGKTFKLPTRPPGGTPGGGKINTPLKMYGFSPKGEGMDGDHVLEIQMGGKDNIRNLWPLDASVNRAAGGKIARMIFDVNSQRIPMSVLKARARNSKSPDVWVKIRSTL